MQISGFSYENSRLNNNFQKLLSIYFYAEHVPKSVIELLHRCNICMSYSWVTENIGNLAVEVREAMIEAARNFPIMFCHNNIRIKFPVRSQRGDHLSVADNGTAMTIIILPEAARAAFEDQEAIRVLRESLVSARALGTPPALSWTDLSNTDRRSRVFRHRLFHLLDILRSIPGLDQSSILQNHILHRPESWHTLPHGPEHRTKMYMLATKPIDESTYSSNVQVINECLRQLKLDRGDPLVRLTLERMMPWVGDDMTVQRCRHVQWFRQEERNGYDRLDPFIFIFGWFHAQMCLVHSVFECSRGSPAGLGLMRSVLKLGRAGFTEDMHKKRPDYHTVVELLMHDFEARIRSLWMWATGTASLEELIAWVQDPNRTAKQILEVAQRIQSQRVSSQAVSECRQHLGEHKDEVLLGTLITTRDLMLHWNLRHAVKHGHVGHMEDLLPELLIYFTGAGNKNYAQQMYEILQLLYHETTPAIRQVHSNVLYLYLLIDPMLRNNMPVCVITGRPSGHTVSL